MKTYHADIERAGVRKCQRFQAATLDKAKRNAHRLAKGATLVALYKEDDEGNWDCAWVPPSENIFPEHSTDLTTTQAAALLGVKSHKTIKNWLEGGNFPGGYQDTNGNWFFPQKNVLDSVRRIEKIRQKNEQGDLAPDDLEGDIDFFYLKEAETE